MSDLYVISGVTGMTGSELARQLVGQGDCVIGFDNFFASSAQTIADVAGFPNFIFYEYDLNNSEQMQLIENEVCAKKKNYARTIYINCAAVVHTEHFYHVNSTFETNVLGMKKFLEQAVRQNAETFINCSTSEVYSMQSFCDDGSGVKESDFITMSTAEHSQRTSYATGKLLTEFFMKDAVDKGKIKGCSIRFANVYSKNELYPKHIIPHILNSLHKKSEVVLLENSRQNRRTFLHNIDSCAAVIALVNSPLALDGSVYNVATDEEITILDLVALCAQKLKIENPKIIFEGFRESDPLRRILNTEKIRAKTNWRPKISLDKGLDMCVEELKVIKGSI